MIFFLSLLIFLLWLAQALDFIPGILFGIPDLKKKSIFPPDSPPESHLPKISIIFAARNEARHVGEALQSMLAQDYPDFEVIAVNDRSTDETLSILEKFEGDPHFKLLNLTDLPGGWIGKNHALWKGYQSSTGGWLLFTDGDVFFDRSALSAAEGAVRDYGLDHLTLFPNLVSQSPVEQVFAYSFIFAFLRRYRPWRARVKKSKAYAGIGAFNFLRREVYEKMGTHAALALDVLDDMHLGRAVKQAGFRLMAMNGAELIRTRWVEGWKGVSRSLQKNAFAGLHFKVSELCLVSLGALLTDILPFILIFLAQGPALGLSLVTLGLIFLSYLVMTKFNPKFLLQFPLHPLGSLLLLALVWRSTLTVLKEGGVRWRETFYPLEILKQ